MKAFILSIPNKLKGINNSIDIKSILSSKVWEVFNDDGVKQVLIFKPKGELIVATEGKVTKSSWQYIAANQSIITEIGTESEMLHPAFLDENILVLRKDGHSNETYIMIDSMETSIFPNRTLTELEAYFSKKNQQLIDAERETEERERERETDKLKNRSLEIEQIVEYIKHNEENIISQRKTKIYIGIFLFLILIFTIISFICYIQNDDLLFTYDFWYFVFSDVWGLMIFPIVFWIALLAIYFSFIWSSPVSIINDHFTSVKQPITYLSKREIKDIYSHRFDGYI